MLKEIWFIECCLRADLTGHGHHIGHEGRINKKETACRAQPIIFSYNLSASFGTNILSFFDLSFQWVSCTSKSIFEWCV